MSVVDLPSVLEQLAGLLRGDTTSEAPAPAEKQAPKYMSVKDYAVRAGRSPKVIRRWIKLGLPMTKAPGVQHQRVIVDAADAWIERGGADAGLRQLGTAAARKGEGA